jgi:hypothetical protein
MAFTTGKSVNSTPKGWLMSQKSCTRGTAQWGERDQGDISQSQLAAVSLSQQLQAGVENALGDAQA